jgi:hypothetical protein
MTTSMIDIHQLCEQVVFINIHITCWTGKRHLQPEDCSTTIRN